ncbi:MAG: response regulator transcription factor [Bacteroidia bacterium]
MINIGIVDDKSVNRETTKRKLVDYNEVNVMMEACNGKDFLTQLKQMSSDQLPHVVLMDLDMPILDGIETIKMASAIYTHIKFIVLTVFEDNDKIFEAIRVGANGYLLKDDKAVNIIDAITNVYEHNGVPMSPAIARRAMDLMLGKMPQETIVTTTESYGLSNRETEILIELVGGSSYTIIGEKLFISPLTVRKHVANLYEKLHVNSRAQIINIAHKNNWL